jgi:flagellar motility protein MotE (MotC chaperone)
MGKVKCEKCGKEFKDIRGLKGHMAGVHGVVGRADYKVLLEELKSIKETIEKINKIHEGIKHLDKEIHEVPEHIHIPAYHIAELNVSEREKLSEIHKQLTNHIPHMLTEVEEKLKGLEKKKGSFLELMGIGAILYLLLWGLGKITEGSSPKPMGFKGVKTRA